MKMKGTCWRSSAKKPTATEDPLEEAIARVQELEEQLKAQVEETSKKEQDLLLRTRAEIDNMRRRSEQDIEKAHKFALEKFSKDILNTIDNLERALATPANKEDENIKALFDGVELTLKELLSTVSRFGVEPVGAVGDTFNPDLHQAISMQPAEGFATNQITTVLQKGYTLKWSSDSPSHGNGCSLISFLRLKERTIFVRFLLPKTLIQIKLLKIIWE